jgi:hypothetical protein
VHVDRLIWARVLPRTRAREQGVLRKLLNYLEFRLGKREPLLPVTKEELLSWIGETSGHVQYKTVVSWVSDLRRIMIDMDIDFSAFETAFFKAGMQGLRRIKGDVKSRQALPISLTALDLVVKVLLGPSLLSSIRQLTLAAAVSLAFGCFLRCGEFTYTKFDDAVHIRRRDVDLTGPIPTLRLRFSKMDRLGQGRTLPIPVVSNPRFMHLCPASLPTFPRLSRRTGCAAFRLFSKPLSEVFSRRRGHHGTEARFGVCRYPGSARWACLLRPFPKARRGHRSSCGWIHGQRHNASRSCSPGNTKGGHQRYVEPSLERRAELARGLYTIPENHAKRSVGYAITDDDVDDAWHNT